MWTLAGMGYGPLSDSSACSNETPDRGVVLVTTSNGMPIGCPAYSPEPKSGWSALVEPIEPISCAELEATGRVSTRWFQGLSAGKIGHLGAAGSRRACAEAAPTASTTAAR